MGSICAIEPLLQNFERKPFLHFHSGCAQYGPDRSCGSALFPDHFAEIGWGHPQFQNRCLFPFDCVDYNFFRAGEDKPFVNMPSSAYNAANLPPESVGRDWAVVKARNGVPVAAAINVVFRELYPATNAPASPGPAVEPGPDGDTPMATMPRPIR
jgi:hypothetical protein